MRKSVEKITFEIDPIDTATIVCSWCLNPMHLPVEQCKWDTNMTSAGSVCFKCTCAGCKKRLEDQQQECRKCHPV